MEPGARAATVIFWAVLEAHADVLLGAFREIVNSDLALAEVAAVLGSSC